MKGFITGLRCMMLMLTVLACLSVSGQQSFDSWLSKAQKGDLYAQRYVAQCYFFGENGVAKNYEETLKWASKAAERGEHYAEYLMAMCYHAGLGVPADRTEAVKWYKRSAEDDKRFAAQLNLGIMYLKGLGTEKDYSQALKYLLRGVENREKAYASGEYGGKNDKHDYDYMIGVCYYYLKNYQNAFKYFESAMLSNSYTTESLLARSFCYSKGIGVKKNKRRGIKLFAEATDDLHASYSIGCYYLSSDLETDYALAKSFLTLATIYGDNRAWGGLAKIYMEGLGCEVDYGKAIEAYENSIKFTKSDISKNITLHNLSICYYRLGEKRYNEKKYNEAFEMLEKAALGENNPIPQAMRLLSACYRYGLGVKKDAKKAKYWFDEAINHNDEDALSILNAIGI